MQRLVERSGSRIDLTGKEFSLLEYLPLNAGPRVTRFMMMMIEHIWNLTFASPTKWLPFMSTICAAKSTIATPQKLIHTVRGVGMS
jgi:two-component system copper resistance phosphate regulon response regulator CusR